MSRCCGFYFMMPSLKNYRKRSIGMEKSEKIVDIETKFSITVDVLHK